MGDGKDDCRRAISDKMYKADVEVDKSRIQDVRWQVSTFSRISLGTVKIKFSEFDRKAMVRIRRPPSGEGIVGLDRRKGFVVTLGRSTDISRSGWVV